jgi:archaetidylinositol phosphate synthase
VVTSIALGMNLLAALALALGARHPRSFIVAVVLLGIAGLLDALDGIVARVQGCESRFGDFLDHFADRVSDTALLAGWTVGAAVNLPLAVTTVVLVALNGYVGTQTEATFGVRSYDGLGRGEYVLTLFILPLVAFTIAGTGAVTLTWWGLTILEWLTALLAVFSLAGVVQRLRHALALALKDDRDHG